MPVFAVIHTTKNHGCFCIILMCPWVVHACVHVMFYRCDHELCTLVYAARQTNVIVVLLLCITAEKKDKGAGAGNTIQEDSLRMPENGFLCLNMRLSCLFYVFALCILLAACLSCEYLWTFRRKRPRRRKLFSRRCFRQWGWKWQRQRFGPCWETIKTHSLPLASMKTTHSLRCRTKNRKSTFLHKMEAVSQCVRLLLLWKIRRKPWRRRVPEGGVPCQGSLWWQGQDKRKFTLESIRRWHSQ